MRIHEVYALRCHACDGAVELLTNVDTYCPACLTWLDVQWHGVPVPPGSYWDGPGMNAHEAEAAQVSGDEAPNSNVETAVAILPPLNDDAQRAAEALARARARHADFDTVWPLMQRLNDVVSFDWKVIGYDDFYEALYVLALYAEFAQPARKVVMEQSRIAQLSQARPVSERFFGGRRYGTDSIGSHLMNSRTGTTRRFSGTHFAQEVEKLARAPCPPSRRMWQSKARVQKLTSTIGIIIYSLQVLQHSFA